MIMEIEGYKKALQDVIAICEQYMKVADDATGAMDIASEVQVMLEAVR